MSKIRIYELAKKLHKSNKEILDELLKIGVEGKTHSSTIEDAPLVRGRNGTGADL
jgi:translation initiation factor IF-2